MKTCAIVDAYSSGNLLAPEFIKRGYHCWHVQSEPEIPSIMLPSFRAGEFSGSLAFEGNKLALVEKLRALNPEIVIAGTETGVELADYLSESLGLFTNGTPNSSSRRNKFQMIEKVRSQGLPVVAQFKSSSVEEIVSWARGHSKVVVKPLQSAGTDGVRVCTTENEIRAATLNILKKKNKLGIMNDEALVQDFLEGTEYFLNTVTYEGHHHFTEIWRYKKRSINGHDCVYDASVLCPYEGATEEKLRHYVEGVLDALGIVYGPAHTEVMMTPQGPYLVETGARLDGLYVPSLNQECIGYSQVDLTVDAYVSESSFREKTSQAYGLKKSAMNVHLTSYQAGTIKSVIGEDVLKGLESFFQMRLRIKPGSQVKKTVDWFTTLGFVTLTHKDPQRLWMDYDTIRKLEHGRFVEYEERPLSLGF